MKLFTIYLDVRLKKFAEEKQSLKNEVQQLHQQLLDSKTQRRSGSMNGPLGDDDYEDVQRNCFNVIKLPHYNGNLFYFRRGE